MKRHVILGILTALILTAIGLTVIISGKGSSEKDERLADAEINSRRTVYPVVTGSPPNINMADPSAEQVVRFCDTVILAEVQGDKRYYTVELITDSNTPEGKIIEKGESMGLESTATFFEYDLKVVEDITGLHKKGDTLTIAANSEFEPYLPSLTKGMHIIVPIKGEKNVAKSARQYYMRTGMFYITDDGYAMSAFEEKTSDKLTGASSSKVIQQMKLWKQDVSAQPINRETQ